MLRQTNRVSSKPLLIIIVIAGICFLRSEASHFRGGTISWKSVGGSRVHFYYKLGWTYGRGPGCQKSLIGKYVHGGSGYWICGYGCGKMVNLHDDNYFCMGADKTENWEQGQNDFVYTFPNKGPFIISFTGGNWIKLSNGAGGGDWNISTVVDLRKRSDTQEPNTSPQSLSKPIYHVQFNCHAEIKIPIIDADDDRIECRWARSSECRSVCKALPFATLDKDSCTITFNTTIPHYIHRGTYAVALTIQDFPRSTITYGTATKTPSDVISSVPIQFLIQTYPDTIPCDSKPRFVNPTPKENEVITIEVGDTAVIGLYADNGINDTSAKANKISASGPVGLQISTVVPDPFRSETFWTNATWTASSKDKGRHIVCAHIENDKRKTGKQRCFSINVVVKGCSPPPCLNSGKCVSNGAKYTCICRPGFQGKNCEIDVIDDCVNNTCLPGKVCVDAVRSYHCVDPVTTTPILMTIPVNKSLCPVDYENCNCFMGKTKQNRWMVYSRKQRDAFMVLVGFPVGLALAVFTCFICFISTPCDKKGCNLESKEIKRISSKKNHRKVN